MRLFGLFLLFSGSVANAENNYYQNLIDIYNQLNHIDGHIGDVISDNNLYHSQIVQLLNHLNGLNGVSNGVVAYPDVLAGNPWWATNSTFVLTRSSYNFVQPDDGQSASDKFSFPQFMSIWSGRLSYSENLPNASQISQWYNRWGTNEVGRLSGQDLRRRSYTWFDWMSDATRSNMVVFSTLGITYDYSNLVTQVASEQVYPTEDETKDLYATNAFPEYVDLIREAETRPAEYAIQQGQNIMETQINHLEGMLNGSTSSSLVVIPEFTVGGIHVRSYSFDFGNNDVVPVAHAVMSFLWGVMLFASLFSLASSEFAFYANLGRNWTVSHGVIKA